MDMGAMAQRFGRFRKRWSVEPVLTVTQGCSSGLQWGRAIAGNQAPSSARGGMASYCLRGTSPLSSSDFSCADRVAWVILGILLSRSLKRIGPSSR